MCIVQLHDNAIPCCDCIEKIVHVEIIPITACVALLCVQYKSPGLICIKQICGGLIRVPTHNPPARLVFIPFACFYIGG